MRDDEATRMRKHPGITFIDGITGRRAKIVGTGIEVWEVIEEYNEIGNDSAVTTELKDTFPHLTERQLTAALNYYHAYPKEIDERIKVNLPSHAKLRKKMKSMQEESAKLIWQDRYRDKR